MMVEPGDTRTLVRTERRPGLVRLVLDRAEEGNALDLQLAGEALAGLRAAEDDPEVHVLTLTGTGRFFCGGGDVRSIAGRPPEQRPGYLAALADAAHELALALASTRLLVVAGVNGAAAGAGLGLVLNADWVLVAEEATLLAAYAGLGLTPDTGVSYLLPRVVGHPRAVELTLGGRRLSGNEAVAWGLANASAPAAVFDGELTVAEDAFLQGAVRTLAPTKRLLRAEMLEGYADHLREESARIAALADHPDTVRRVNRFAGR
ncbi:enoyl-CoA hydratase/isomerase family protein [Arthrobacter sp. JSM 101049]|uniref:enoyl-CoA hydratase/isomerase family protein n=1 Tax=Arthrobacter sp. JSM 101049 TaxID=929097 RepID=UPI003568FD10